MSQVLGLESGGSCTDRRTPAPAGLVFTGGKGTAFGQNHSWAWDFLRPRQSV